jgi:hypothetical protein
MLASHTFLARKLDSLEKKYDKQFAVVFEVIRQLMELPLEKPERKIGFLAKENRTDYVVSGKHNKNKER